MSDSPLEWVAAPMDLEGLEEADLSPWFNSFLGHFAREARRCGGEIRVVRDADRVLGMTVSDPVERVVSVFTRARAIAEPPVRARGPFGMFSDFPFEPSAEGFDVFRGGLSSGGPIHRFRHPVRPLKAQDLPNVRDLMREVNGAVNDRWFEGLPTPTEAGFVAEVDGRLAGVGWVTRVGSHARLHSLSVRAPYRRLGLGTDLLFARLLWARGAGAAEALSEISRSNSASRAIAWRSGMRPVGEIYFHPPLARDRAER